MGALDRNNLYAVVTGDIAESSGIHGNLRGELVDTLKQSFSLVEKHAPSPGVTSPFEIFRGDSFQGVLADPSYALRCLMFIRTTLRSHQPEQVSKNWDARISAGIGTIDYLTERGSEGDGDAYRRSGPYLDQMKGEKFTSIITPWESVNRELNTETALLDALISKWTPFQAETVQKLMEGKIQREIGDELGVSQSAVHYRTKGAGWFAVNTFLERFESLIIQQSST